MKTTKVFFLCLLSVNAYWAQGNAFQQVWEPNQVTAGWPDLFSAVDSTVGVNSCPKGQHAVVSFYIQRKEKAVCPSPWLSPIQPLFSDTCRCCHLIRKLTLCPQLSPALFLTSCSIQTGSGLLTSGNCVPKSCWVPWSYEAGRVFGRKTSNYGMRKEQRAPYYSCWSKSPQAGLGVGMHLYFVLVVEETVPRTGEIAGNNHFPWFALCCVGDWARVACVYIFHKTQFRTWLYF